MIIESVEVHQLAEEGYDGYERMVIETIENGKKEFLTGDFFVDVIWRKKRAARGGLAKEALALENIPTPHYNQTVYLYHRAVDELEMLWTVPPQEVCLAYYHNKHLVPASEYSLLEQVMNFYDGTLFKLIDKYDKKKEKKYEFIQR